MPSTTLPLIENFDPQRELLWLPSGVLRQGAFVAQVQALARTLPDAPGINLCEGRHGFMLAFAALLLRGQPNLLPASAAPGAVMELARRHPGAYVLCERDLPDLDLPSHIVAPVAGPAMATSAPQIPAAQVAAVAYTSGSTGTPQPHPKRWDELLAGVRLSSRRFMGTPPGAQVVATVPAQHMYGLETSVMMALAGGCTLHGARPFFPRDIADALAAVPAPRVLITTPAHLRACLAAGIELPALRLVISATAPLAPDVAAEVERRWNCELQEIYGCTEAGSLAARRTVETDIWTLHPGLQLDEACVLHAPQLSTPLALQDQLERLDETRFRLLARNGDLIKVAGKRASLADLNARLLALDGIEDGVVFMPSDAEDARPAALVVAPRLDEREILARLAQVLDPVLLPRPLRRVAQLPRNELGKLPRAALLAALAPSGPETFRIAADHPALPGHFPGRPVVPGVVVLEHVAAAARARSGRGVKAVPSVKFLRPLLPEQTCAIRLEAGTGQRMTFRCECEGALIAQGSLELAP